MEKDNVIKFPQKAAIFSHPLRQKLETGITTFTDKPNETITEIEHIICAHIISWARSIMTRIGEKAGTKLAEKVRNG